MLHISYYVEGRLRDWSPEEDYYYEYQPLSPPFYNLNDAINSLWSIGKTYPGYRSYRLMVVVMHGTSVTKNISKVLMTYTDMLDQRTINPLINI